MTDIFTEVENELSRNQASLRYDEIARLYDCPIEDVEEAFEQAREAAKSMLRVGNSTTPDITARCANLIISIIHSLEAARNARIVREFFAAEMPDLKAEVKAWWAEIPRSGPDPR